MQVLLDIKLRQVLNDFTTRTVPCPPIDGETFDERLARVRQLLAQFERYLTFPRL